MQNLRFSSHRWSGQGDRFSLIVIVVLMLVLVPA